MSRSDLGWRWRKCGRKFPIVINYSVEPRVCRGTGADVVTADGKLVHASEGENADLLWALRGGGGNVGVVTGFEFAVHPVGPEVMFCAPIYPIDAGAKPIRFWRDFLADRNDRVGSLVEFSTI